MPVTQWPRVLEVHSRTPHSMSHATEVRELVSTMSTTPWHSVSSLHDTSLLQPRLDCHDVTIASRSWGPCPISSSPRWCAGAGWGMSRRGYFLKLEQHRAAGDEIERPFDETASDSRGSCNSGHERVRTAHPRDDFSRGPPPLAPRHVIPLLRKAFVRAFRDLPSR